MRSILTAASNHNWRILRTSALLSVCALSAAVGDLEAASTLARERALPPEVFRNVADYGFMCWSNGPASSHYAIRTSRYGMVFDWRDVSPTILMPYPERVSESTALNESWEESFPRSPSAQLSCQVVAGGKPEVLTSTGRPGDVQVVENGKFFQRRWHPLQTGGLPLNTNLSGLEVAAWPDRLCFLLRAVPSASITNAVLKMTFELPEGYTNLLSKGDAYACGNSRGQGFAILKSAGAASLEVDRHIGRIMVSSATSDWATNQEISVGLILYPAADKLAEVVSSALATEEASLPVVAKCVLPPGPESMVTYEKDQGWHRVVLPNQGTTGADGIVRVAFEVTNSTPRARVLRLNFDGVPFSMPGISAVIRDKDLFPVGIPVQLSKNWHGTPEVRFGGGWFHGLTMLTVPAHSRLQLELCMVGQNWGGLPAATHSQLSVIGYARDGNQQWDEAALGNYGEAFCYDVEHSLTDNDCTDSRPIYMLDDKGNMGQWCANLGGAQFLRYYDLEGRQLRHSQMRTRYARYCPNLAEAVFAGRSEDAAMAFSFSAGLYRSDDYSRAVHRLRMDVKSDFTFSRLVFFQQAADTYAGCNGTTLAYGNRSSAMPLRRWTATPGKTRNIGIPVELPGRMPWAMTLDCAAPSPYTPGNRGFVIRSWKSKINGVADVPPFIVERSTAETSIFDIVPPPGVTGLKAGDFLEAEIVRFYVPSFQKDYYGPNKVFAHALAQHENSYRLGLREAAGNDLKVKVGSGRLERTFPVQVQATGNRARFEVTGGLGFVPVTVTGLTGYREPVLEERIGRKWVRINQAVHGNDFWQADFNAERGTWELTFNLNMDGTNCVDLATMMRSQPTRSYRFRMNEGSASSLDSN